MELFEYIDILKQPYDMFYTDSVHSPLHWHYYSEILYMINGSMRIVCNNMETILHAGDLCYFYPLQLHEVEPDSAYVCGTDRHLCFVNTNRQKHQ